MHSIFNVWSLHEHTVTFINFASVGVMASDSWCLHLVYISTLALTSLFFFICALGQGVTEACVHDYNWSWQVLLKGLFLKEYPFYGMQERK